MVGACAQAEEPALATQMIKPKNVNRTRKGMRLAKSPRIEDTARRVSGTNGCSRELWLEGSGFTQLSLSDGLEVVETALEMLPGNPVHVHKDAHDLHDIEICTVHGPGNLG